MLVGQPGGSNPASPSFGGSYRMSSVLRSSGRFTTTLNSSPTFSSSSSSNDVSDDVMSAILNRVNTAHIDAAQSDRVNMTGVNTAQVDRVHAVRVNTVQTRSNSLDDDSGSSGGMEAFSDVQADDSGDIVLNEYGAHFETFDNLAVEQLLIPPPSSSLSRPLFHLSSTQNNNSNDRYIISSRNNSDRSNLPTKTHPIIRERRFDNYVTANGGGGAFVRGGSAVRTCDTVDQGTVDALLQAKRQANFSRTRGVVLDPLHPLFTSRGGAIDPLHPASNSRGGGSIDTRPLATSSTGALFSGTGGGMASTDNVANPASNNYVVDDVPLPIRTKRTTWRRKNSTDAAGNIASRSSGGVKLGRSMSDSPCYLSFRQATLSPSDQPAQTTRSNEDFSSAAAAAAASVPPLPPRDYPGCLPPKQFSGTTGAGSPRAAGSGTGSAGVVVGTAGCDQSKGRAKNEIHPIMRDGVKQSDTHYFLIESKLPRSFSPSAASYSAERKEDYVNVSTRTNNSSTLWLESAYPYPASSPSSLSPSAVSDKGRTAWGAGGGVGALSRLCLGSEVGGSGNSRGVLTRINSRLPCCVGDPRATLHRSNSESTQHLIRRSSNGSVAGEWTDQSSVDSLSSFNESDRTVFCGVRGSGGALIVAESQDYRFDNDRERLRPDVVVSSNR